MSRVPLLLMLWIPAAAAAGLFGSDAPGRIPIPARLFEADIEDVDGVSLHVERLTFDGEVFLFGTISRAQVTVPFERIARVEFTAGSDAGSRTARVTLTDGKDTVLVLDADLPLYGLAHFGNYRLDVAHARRVVIRPSVTAESRG